MDGEKKRPRGRPREFDRGEALVKALKLFWAKGYEQTTISDLCAALGINPPSLYAAFGNKATLFLEAVRHYESTYWSGPAARFMAAASIHQAVRDYFQEAAMIMISPAAPCGCMTVVAAVNISESETDIINALKDLRQAPVEMFTEGLRRAMNDGQIPLDANIPVLALALAALLEGMSLRARDGVYLADLKALGALAVRLLPAPPSSVKMGERPSLL